MTDQELVSQFIAKNGVTRCEPAIARGAETSKRFRKDFNSARKSRQMMKLNESKRNG